MLNIHPIPAFYDNYIWMISHPESKEAVIVDPGQSQGVITALSTTGYTLKAILVTHHHHDHTGGIKSLAERYRAPIYGPANENIPACTHPLKEGDEVPLLSMNLVLRVMDIPGHTKGHIAYFGSGLLFCGDTLFGAGCGRIFEGTPAQMVQSLQKLSNLPPETKVYCAHEYTAANLRFAKLIEPENMDIKLRIKDTEVIRSQNKPTLPSTIAIEKLTNPFLRCDEPAVIKSAEKYANKRLQDEPNGVFTTIRQWKDKF